MGIIYEISLAEFLFVTVILGGGAAYLTGRAIAITWRPVLSLVWFIFLLNLFVRFIHFSLYSGTLLTAQYFIVDYIVLLGLALLGYRITRTTQMVTQYSWLYQRTSPVGWKEKT